MNTVKITKGVALVIAGPEGCGKSTMARAIAALHGTFAEIGITELESSFGLGRVLDAEPDTLIVDGLPTKAETLNVVKAALANNTICCHRKHQEVKIVKAPNFIFCTGLKDAIPIGPQERRFRVVKVS